MKIEPLVRKTFEPISPDAGVTAVEGQLLKHGFLVVQSQHKFWGILTSADIVESPHRLVVDCLHEKPCADVADDVNAVIGIMKQSGNSVLPVFKENNFVGVIEQQEIAAYLLEYRRDLENEISERIAELSEVNVRLAAEIEQRRQKGKALRESEARFRALIEDSPESLILTDVQGTVLAASRVGAQRIRKKLSGVIGRSAFEHLSPEVAARRRALFEQVIATGHPFRLEDARDDFHFDIHINPIRDADGKVSRLAILAIDITDRRRAEEGLRESEKRFRALVEDNPESLIVTDVQGTILAASRVTARRVGKELAEIVGTPAFEHLPPEVAARRRSFFDQAVATGRPLRFEDTRDNFHFENHYTPILDADGKVSMLAIMALDITDRKQAEEGLRGSENKYRTLVENIPQKVFIKNRDSRFVSINQNFARDLGIRPEEVLGKVDYDFFPREFADKYRADDKRIMETGRTENIEERYIQEGKEIWVNTIKTPVKDENANIVGVLGAFFDITERKRAEQALKESEERFRAIFATAQDTIFIKDRSFKYTQVNPAMERLFGRPAAEIVGKTDLDLVGAAETDRIWKQDRRVLNGEVVKGVHTLQVQGGPIKSHYIKAPLYGDAGEIVGICGIVRDITDLNRAEDALKESEERFRMLFDYAPDAYILADMQGEIIDCNQAAEELAGYSREELIGNNFACLPWLDFRQQVRLADLLAQTARGEVMGPVDFNLTRKDGGEVIAEGMSLPLYIQGQNLVLTIVRDITARKQAEAALRESETRFRHISSTISDISYSCTAEPDGRYAIDWLAGAAERITGYTVEEIKARRCWEFLVIEADQPRFERHITGLAPGASGDCELRLRHKNGGIVWVAAFAKIVQKPEHPELLSMYGGLVDITARKQAEAEMRESEHRFRLMAETIQDVFWISTPDLRKVLYVSPAFEQIWGRGCEELYQAPRTFMEAVHPEDQRRVRAEMLAAQDQETAWSHEYRIIQPGGAGRWIHDRGYPIRDDQGRVILFTGVATDITDHKALEEQLLQAQKMEAVGRLAGGVAHDFNNILMAIMGYGELMRGQVLKDDPLYGHLENILKAGDRATALTRQLLTFSRQKIVHLRVIDLNRAVLDLEPMLRRLIGEDLDLEVVTDRRPGTVKADPGQVDQIIMNLVVNARDAMPQGGRLTLKIAAVDFAVGCRTRFGLAPPGAYVRLEVQDTGVGMDEATQAHVFEPFFTTKEPGKGTGLGLSTVYGIVKQSGGYLDLESSPGAGSTFTIYLPRLKAIVETPKAKIPLTAVFRGEETILLVEDEDMLRGLLAKFLRLYGYTVLEARHGGEALLTCERHPGPIHLMVTDVVMPQMSGRELADRLTPLRPEMKILYMSGYTEDALVQHGVADLSVAFLQKPFRPIELARRVHAVLHPPVSQ